MQVAKQGPMEAQNAIYGVVCLGMGVVGIRPGAKRTDAALGRSCPEEQYTHAPMFRGLRHPVGPKTRSYGYGREVPPFSVCGTRSYTYVSDTYRHRHGSKHAYTSIVRAHQHFRSQKYAHQHPQDPKFAHSLMVAECSSTSIAGMRQPTRPYTDIPTLSCTGTPSAPPIFRGSGTIRSGACRLHAHILSIPMRRHP